MSIQTEAARPLIAVADRQPSSPQPIARLSGLLYLIIAAAAIVAHMYMPSTLIVADDPGATAANIQANQELFRLGGIGAELVVLLSEVVLSLLLYFLLKPVSPLISLLAAGSRLVMTGIHGLNLLNYGLILLLLGNPVYAEAFEATQIAALVSLFLEAHGLGFTLGIAFLVIHVLGLGFLIYRSGYFPRLLGVLFLLAGMGYGVDTVGLLFVRGYTTTPGAVALVIALAELAFPLWLLVRGVDRRAWAARAGEDGA